MADGRLRVDARLTRTGVFEYALAGGGVRRELRLPSEVFDGESIASFDLAPVCVDHHGLLSTTNLRTHRVGVLAGKPRQDGKYLTAELQVDDEKTVQRVDSKELCEISVGYTCSVEQTAGEYEGEKYDCIQRGIRANHIAIGPKGWGRAGRECAMHLDSADADVAISFTEDAKENIDMDIAELAAAKAKQEARADAAESKAKADSERADALQLKLDGTNKELATAQAERDASKARADGLEKQLGVFARRDLEAQVKPILGADYKFDGKSDAEVRGAVVAVVLEGIKLDGKSADYAAAMFDLAVAQHDKLARKSTETVVKQDKADPQAGKSARELMLERNTNAWKGAV
ncbi:MAG: Erwinia phage phiEt88 [Pseudomonadota bacterium]|jgi:hypothetical protein